MYCVKYWGYIAVNKLEKAYSQGVCGLSRKSDNDLILIITLSIGMSFRYSIRVTKWSQILQNHLVGVNYDELTVTTTNHS